MRFDLSLKSVTCEAHNLEFPYPFNAHDYLLTQCWVCMQLLTAAMDHALRIQNNLFNLETDVRNNLYIKRLDR